MSIATLISWFAMEYIYHHKTLSKAKLMFWAMVLSFGVSLSFSLLLKPNMAFRPGREIDENLGSCPGIHKVKELNRWNCMILISGFCFVLSIAYR